MRLFKWRWLVVSSVLVASLAAETRPQYGGTLRLNTRAAFASLDPADGAQMDSFARRSVMMLMFDTLVATDEGGRVRGSLAVSWEAAQANQRWQFRLRRGVRFHDGTPLIAEIAAASLRVANPAWKVSVEGETLMIESSDLDLLSELALPRNAIVKRTADAKPSGTGPFHVADWQPGKKLTLTAEDDCWRGRPYLDGIEVELGKSYREQTMALDLAKADLVEVPAEQVHRASLDGRGVVSSSPVELLALVFAHDVKSADEKSLRDALALSVERVSIRSVLLQGAGQSAGGVLPNWMSGYEFMFPTDTDLPRARHAREQVRTIPTWTLGYDGSDSVARLVAERVALNARDAGLSVQPISLGTASAMTDLRVVRIPLATADPWIALESVVTVCGVTVAKPSAAIEDLYASERAVLSTQRIVPLFHLPVSYAASSSLRNWSLHPDGTLNLADAWLGSKQP